MNSFKNCWSQETTHDRSSISIIITLIQAFLFDSSYEKGLNNYDVNSKSTNYEEKKRTIWTIWLINYIQTYLLHGRNKGSYIQQFLNEFNKVLFSESLASWITLLNEFKNCWSQETTSVRFFFSHDCHNRLFKRNKPSSLCNNCYFKK